MPAGIENRSVKSPPHGGADRNHGGAASRRRITGRPLTGARIETAPPALPSVAARCRPLTGARIETYSRVGPVGRRLVVAPSRGRGSKQASGGYGYCHSASPPHGGADRNSCEQDWINRASRRPLTGARIETPAAPAMNASQPAVAPSRGRGSKLSVPVPPGRVSAVAPSRGRGSKHKAEE